MADVSLARRLAAEALGSAALACVVVGSGIMAERLASGNAALALLGNTLATGAALVVLITALAPISGAHFNPAVSLVEAIERRLAPRDFFAYIVAQTAAMIAGVWVAHLMFDLPVLQTSMRVRAGAAQCLAEGVAAFGLVATILLTSRARPAAVPALVAAYISAAYWFTASTSFANPAITVARSLSNSFAGIRPADVSAFVLAQFAGALLALGVCRWLLAGTAAQANR